MSFQTNKEQIEEVLIQSVKQNLGIFDNLYKHDANLKYIIDKIFEWYVDDSGFILLIHIFKGLNTSPVQLGFFETVVEFLEKQLFNANTYTFALENVEVKGLKILTLPTILEKQVEDLEEDEVNYGLLELRYQFEYYDHMLQFHLSKQFPSRV